MVLPIVTYNDSVLRKKAESVKENSDDLQEFIDDLFDTMYNSNGVGLAAPQVGRSIQLFVTDSDAMTEESEEPDIGPLVFINPEIVESGGEELKMEEGCLSIPEVRDEVVRPDLIKVRYLNRDFEEQELEVDGWLSRVIQHEYDHLQGVLFLDHLSAFRRRLHRSRLKKIEQGLLETDYPLIPKNSEKL